MHRRCSLLLTALFAAALACAPAGAPTPSTSARATGLAQTAAALLTSTAAARATLVTPVPASPTFTGSPAPTATATPSVLTATPVPLPGTPTAIISPTPCENDSAFVSDVSIPDGTHFAPGAAFIKTWRLRNDGVCAWTTGYTLRLVGGDAMSGAAVNLPSAVPAGGSVDISVALVAPNSNGRFSGQWQLHSPEGAPFGAKPFVEIVVP